MKKDCNNCGFSKKINSAPVGWSFTGCTHEPYQGKRCAEIEKCPREYGVRDGESCWLVEFEDGYKVILNEEIYKKNEERKWDGRKVLCEEHWFNIKKCIDKNRGVPMTVL